MQLQSTLQTKQLDELKSICHDLAGVLFLLKRAKCIQEKDVTIDELIGKNLNASIEKLKEIMPKIEHWQKE